MNTTTNSTDAQSSSAPDEDKIKNLTQKVADLESQIAQAQRELVEAGGTVNIDSPAGSGISSVSFTVQKRDDAEELATKLFKENLIADAQFQDNNYERMYMLYKKEQEDDHQVRVRFITADSRVPLLIKFIKEHNPNHYNGPLPPDIVSVQENSGSADYIAWVKKQTAIKETDQSSLDLDNY